ncbi:MAG: EamA family transporter [Bacteroidetes bacterium]|nr:EamA family transporter [Bacteroidota bacterium]
MNLKAGILKYFIAAFSAVIVWGFFSIPLRMLQDYPSEQILYYRIFTSLLLTWLYIFLFRKNQIKLDIKYIQNEENYSVRKIIWLSLIAGLLITGNWFTYIYVVNNVSLKSAVFAYMVCPLITALGGYLILKEKLSTLKLIALGFASVSIVILAQGSLRDVLWSVLVAALYSFYLIIQRVMVQIDKFNMLGLHLLIAALLMLPFFLSDFEFLPSDPNFWITIVVISVFFTIIPLFLSLYALIGMPSSTLGIIIYINPIVAFAVAFFYFHEEISRYQVYSYLLLLAAVIVFNWATIKEILFKTPANKTPAIIP